MHLLWISNPHGQYIRLSFEMTITNDFDTRANDLIKWLDFRICLPLFAGFVGWMCLNKHYLEDLT